MKCLGPARARFCAAVALLALICSTSSAGRAQGTATLRIATIPADNGAEVYYAKDMGFFDRAGLAVEIQPIQNSSASASAVAGGAIDISYGTLVPLSIAHT